ncbi:MULTISPECIES: PAS domain S-box protein [unclassified Methanoregula]|uniref:PAS domain S-box protein n=1 Tax=unclassified Methanoregula TaxID=2649730 RepID=UPI0009D549DA|nr:MULTISPECIES: PAS domain S-box protein [unclassified Methanoregula]OPX64422.1 MAG: sensory histidine kinase AtoS [Methanoregula sp. PtaB.Bin085]OPY34908.1 MAG: sensory histidine kinase AtoS [Methanoregula sp. PtaU1.Bin006]
MTFNADPVTFINLAFCVGVVALSLWWYGKTKSRTPLFIGLAFGLFGISHTFILFGLNRQYEQIYILVRMAAYAIVALGLFFIALDVIHRKKAEDDLLHANEELRAANDQLRRSAAELKNNLEELNRKREELAESEKKFRSIFNSLIDLYFQTDINGTILMASPSLKLLSGWEPEELIGTNVVALYPDEKQRRALVDELKRNGRVQDYLVRLKNRAGYYINASVNCHIIRDSDGNPVLIEGTIRDVTEKKAAEDALSLAQKKLNLLNTVTFQDIQNAVFSLNGYLELQQEEIPGEVQKDYVTRERELVGTISASLNFAALYQTMGQNPPGWQNVHHAFLYGISHLNLPDITRTISLDGLEIYADPMLENIFFTLAENVVTYAKGATEISLTYREDEDGLTISFADNGPAIPPAMKEKIFERHYERKRGAGLFLAREILSLTGITIHETGGPHSGARFDLRVKKGGYRFAGNKDSLHG